MSKPPESILQCPQKIHQISPEKSTEIDHHPAAAIRARRPAMKSFRLATVTWRVVRPPGGAAQRTVESRGVWP